MTDLMYVMQGSRLFQVVGPMEVKLHSPVAILARGISSVGSHFSKIKVTRLSTDRSSIELQVKFELPFHQSTSG